MPKFNPQQLEAIQARGSNLLVSAAAGSGKTTVLVERILALLGEGVDPARPAGGHLHQGRCRRDARQAPRAPGGLGP